MATGDNILTALSVGRKCRIVPKNDTVFLGDLEVIRNKEFLTWKISTEHDEVANDNVDIDLDHSNSEYSLLPWKKQGVQKFTIAITGKAFNYLLRTPSL